MKRKYIPLAIVVAAALLLTNVLHIDWSSDSNFSISIGKPSQQTAQQQLPQSAQGAQEIIDQIYKAKPKYSFDSKEDAMEDYLEDNIYCRNILQVKYDGTKKESSWAYTIDPNGERTLIEYTWYYGDVISSDVRGPHYAIYKQELYMPVCVGHQSSPYGRVYIYYLYPLDDCLLSSQGLLETAYDPSTLDSFNEFMRLVNYLAEPRQP